ncbi:MAG: PAS domain S-box protein [Methanobacterium sp.]|uniref:histidine kinase dimerization/phosphoacceptor domain -containing protein n=1 Tax=Methanobacterium sp. TaxID=2164 RepID=UPI003D64D82B|nr:PAS domain S-box protein [Methanobacterium sp.]
MNVYALISFIAFIVCFFLGNFIYHKNPKNQLNIMILILCTLVGILALVEFEYRQTNSFETAYFWLKISGLWPLVPAVLLHISLIFTKSKVLMSKFVYIALYLPALIISYLAINTNMLLSGIILEYWGWTYAIPSDMTLYYIMALWTVSAVVLAGLICLSYYLKSKNLKKKQAKYVFTGLYMPLFISLISDFILPGASVRVPEMTMTMMTVGIGFISYGIWKYRFPALTTAIAADKIVSTMSNFFILLDYKKNIININQSTIDLLGYNNSELIGKSINYIFPEKTAEKIFNKKEELRRDGFITNIETVFRAKDGNLIPVFLSISLILSDDSKILGIVCIGSDIIDIHQAKNEIKASLQEKELLLREVHHRVKNNLQIISSLLSLQSGYIKDEDDLELFKDSQSRVKSMAFIHEQLYNSSDFTSIEFSEYIQNLVTYLLHYYNVDPTFVKLKINVENVSLDINTAIPCGLIINELVSNSLKHAFPRFNNESVDLFRDNDKKGEVYLDLHSVNQNKFVLIVSDNGIGLPEDFDFENIDTLGLQLVKSLLGQLDGSIKIDRINGTKFEIVFNKLEYKKRM